MLHFQQYKQKLYYSTIEVNLADNQIKVDTIARQW